MSDAGVASSCEFVTERLRVGPWHAAAETVGGSLAEVVAGVLTERTTEALPPPWQGSYSIDRAASWIRERDEESPTLLVVDTTTQRPVGLVVLYEISPAATEVELRIGYVIAEDAWGRGLATELVSGLVEWARDQPTVRALTGGVDLANRASVRVLEKSEFERIGVEESGQAIYRVDVEPESEWDQYADGWDADEAARAYAAAAFASLQNVLRETGVTLAGSSVIDFGCGTGLLTEYLVDAGATVCAIDTSRAMLDVLHSKLARLGPGEVETSTRIPPEQSAYDLVVCSSVCSFLADYPAAVEELVSRLGPGGLFVQWDWERTGDDPHGLTRAEVKAALAGAGLVGVEVVTAFDVAIEGQVMAPLMGRGRRPEG